MTFVFIHLVTSKTSFNEKGMSLLRFMELGISYFDSIGVAYIYRYYTPLRRHHDIYISHPPKVVYNISTIVLVIDLRTCV